MCRATPRSLTRPNVSQQDMIYQEGLAESRRARHMCGHAAHPHVGELSRPSEPPCPYQHTHAAVLVTLGLTIVDLICFE